MRGKLRLGVRFGLAAVLATALLLGIVGRGNALIQDDTPPPPPTTVTIGSLTTPVAEGAPSVTFPISFDNPASAAFDIDYTPSAGDSGVIPVGVGDTGETLTLPVPDDGVPNADGAFSVTLTNVETTPDVAIIGTPATGTVPLIDSDWRISGIGTDPGSATVSEAGGNTLDFQVSLQDPSGNPVNAIDGHPVTVDYTVKDGSAKLGKNYSITEGAAGNPASSTLTFKPGQSSVDVQIKSIDDGVYGNNTTFTVSFHDPSGASFASNAQTLATGTITEADAAPYMGISSCQGGSVTGGSTATFPIALGADSPTSVPSSVDYKTVDDSTITGDYTPVSSTATIAPGQREFDVQVQTAQNPPAGSRSFHIQLSNPKNVRLLETSSPSCTIVSTASGGGGGGSGGSGSGGSIAITDPQPVDEPTSGSTSVSVPLSLTLPNPLPSSPGDVSVQWHTVDGTATAPTAYTAASGNVTWPAGTSGSKLTAVTVNINPDPAVTNPVTFTVAFSSADATFVGDPTATITIVPAGSTISMLSIADASAPSQAGSIAVPVTLTPASSQTVTIAYATADGTDANAAAAGTNYKATSGTITFAPGDRAKTISVPIVANTSTQPNRDFTVDLSNPTGGGTIAVGKATVTILNDFSVLPPPPIAGSGGIQVQPVPLPTRQHTPTSGPTTGGPTGSSGSQTHLVLVQLYTGTAKVNAKGVAVFKIGCPVVAVTNCKGTAAFDVGVKEKLKGKSIVKTVRVANGSFTAARGNHATLNAKLTVAGLKLLATYKRMQVKVTLTSKDASGATGVTAWLATLQAPAAKTKTKPAVKTKKKSKGKAK